MGPMSSIPNCGASSNMPQQVGQNVMGVPFNASMTIGVQSSFVPSQLPWMNYGLNTFPPIEPPPNFITQVPAGFNGNANFPGNGFFNQMQPAVQLLYVYPGQDFPAGNQNNQPNFGYNVQQGYPVLAGNQNIPTNYQNGIHENQNGYQGNKNGNQGNQNVRTDNHNGYEVPDRVANNNGNRNRRLARVDVLPKTLRYNENDNWNAFKQKFDCR